MEFIIGFDAAPAFQRILRATSLAHSLGEGGDLRGSLSIEVLKGIGLLAGHDILYRLEEQLRPRKLAQASKSWFQAYFLLIIGTILSVAYTFREHESPRFPANSDNEGPSPQSSTLWDAMKENLCQILSHYLLLLGSKPDLNIPAEIGMDLVNCSHSRWVQGGQYSWTTSRFK